MSAKVRLTVSAAMLCVLGGTARAQQQAPAEEYVGPDLITAERIASLRPDERAAWTSYVQRSSALHARDLSVMRAELLGLGSAVMTKAPYSAPDFRLDDRPDSWILSDSGRAIADAVLTYQTPSGGWSKRTDMTHPRPAGTSYYSELPTWHYIPTFDNGATTGQLRFLARAARLRGDERYVEAWHRGLRLVFAAQQPNGCWPQSFPLEGGYHDAITFNDDANVLILRLLDDVASGEVTLGTPAERESARTAAKRGLACVLAVQVRINGRRTVWGQQHDPITLSVVGARKYEIPGLAGRESANIVMYLMSLLKPDTSVIAAVYGANEWFASHAIRGYRYAGYALTADASAGPIWPRLTDMVNDRPIFANRDGIKLYDFNKLTDRRTGYGWFGTEPEAVMRQFAAWKRVYPEY